MSTRETPAEREFDYDRTVALSDGVFAIAITLLVLSIDFPRLPHPADQELWGALLDQGLQILSYVISFAVIALLWVGHHTFFRELRRIDGRLAALNLTYLGLVAFLPYPTDVLGDYGGHAPAVVFYAATIALVSLAAAVMRGHAARAGLLTAAGRRDPLVRLLVVPAVFLVSIPVAFVTPNGAKLVWLALVAQGRLPWARARARRARRSRAS